MVEIFDLSHISPNLYTRHQSPLVDAPHHPPVTTGYVTNMVTYVTHPSSHHCGWSVVILQWMLDGETHFQTHFQITHLVNASPKSKVIVWF